MRPLIVVLSTAVVALALGAPARGTTAEPAAAAKPAEVTTIGPPGSGVQVSRAVKEAQVATLSHPRTAAPAHALGAKPPDVVTSLAPDPASRARTDAIRAAKLAARPAHSALQPRAWSPRTATKPTEVTTKGTQTLPGYTAAQQAKLKATLAEQARQARAAAAQKSAPAGGR